jgi:hypothetical protein
VDDFFDQVDPARIAAVRYERDRIDAWIRNRLVPYPLASCFGCRKPIVAGAAWEEVSNGDTNARARFHRACHAGETLEWARPIAEAQVDLDRVVFVDPVYRPAQVY